MLLAPGVGDLLTERLNTAIESGGTGRTAIWAVGLNVVPDTRSSASGTATSHP